jgi:hypothetical protein
MGEPLSDETLRVEQNNVCERDTWCIMFKASKDHCRLNIRISVE